MKVVTFWPAVDALYRLAPQSVRPDGEIERRGATHFERCFLHAGSFGEHVGRVDDQLTRCAGERPTLENLFDVVPLLELREIGVLLRGVRRLVGFEHPPVGLVNTPAQDAPRFTPFDESAPRLGPLLDIGACPIPGANRRACSARALRRR